MIKFEHVEVTGWEAAIRGMRNPKESWDRSDSVFGVHYAGYGQGYYGHDIFRHRVPVYNNIVNTLVGYEIGPNDLDLMKRLAKAGSDHRKYMRMINVTVDITAPLYWWRDFDAYKVGTVCNACSTIHKLITTEPFSIDNFSHEHLYPDTLEHLKETIHQLNDYRDIYLDSKDKNDWWQIKQLLPDSYNQKRTIQVNYETLANIRRARAGHPLDEFSRENDAIEMCMISFIDSLPYHEIIDIAAGVPSEEDRQKIKDTNFKKGKILNKYASVMTQDEIAALLEIPISRVETFLGACKQKEERESKPYVIGVDLVKENEEEK